MGSVGQRAAKLLAFKVGGLKKVCRFGYYSLSVNMGVWPRFDSVRVGIILKV